MNLAKKSANTAPFKKIDRSKLMDISSGLIDQLWGRLNVKRFKEQGGDSVRLQYTRAMVQALQAHNAILKDEELDEINRRLEKLEAVNNGNQTPGKKETQ